MKIQLTKINKQIINFLVEFLILLWVLIVHVLVAVFLIEDTTSMAYSICAWHCALVWVILIKVLPKELIYKL